MPHRLLRHNLGSNRREILGYSSSLEELNVSLSCKAISFSHNKKNFSILKVNLKRVQFGENCKSGKLALLLLVMAE